MGIGKVLGSKKQLEIALSRLKEFEKGKVRDEQYTTPSSIAAEVLWKAYYNKDIEGKVIVDMGCGTGILGIGCLLLGAKRVIFIDKDKEALSISEENIRKIEGEYNTWEGKEEGEEGKGGREGKESSMGTWECIGNDVNIVDKNRLERVDTVVTNPPFGTKNKGADKEFLLKAFEISNVTYSFHKTNTKEYIMQIAEKSGKIVGERFDFNFMLRNTMAHHTKAKKYIEVSCFVFRIKNMMKDDIERKDGKRIQED